MNDKAMTEKWCWWTDSEEHYRICETLLEAHGEAQCQIDNEHDDGDEVIYYVGQPCHPLDAIMHEHRMLWTGERVFEQIDEWCGDETGAEDWTMDITKEDKEALGKLVLDFLRQNAKVQWWGLAKGHTEHKYIAGSEK